MKDKNHELKKKKKNKRTKKITQIRKKKNHTGSDHVFKPEQKDEVLM